MIIVAIYYKSFTLCIFLSNRAVPIKMENWCRAKWFPFLESLVNNLHTSSKLENFLGKFK